MHHSAAATTLTDAHRDGAGEGERRGKKHRQNKTTRLSQQHCDSGVFRTVNS